MRSFTNFFFLSFSSGGRRRKVVACCLERLPESLSGSLPKGSVLVDGVTNPAGWEKSSSVEGGDSAGDVVQWQEASGLTGLFKIIEARALGLFLFSPALAVPVWLKNYLQISCRGSCIAVD